MTEDRLSELVQTVKKKQEYSNICEDLVLWVGKRELEKRRFKEAVKHTRAKLHQVAGAYLGSKIDLGEWTAALRDIPRSIESDVVREYCLRVMAQHTSTQERLPILGDFYTQTLQSIGPLRSVLDIGCGLNPLALPWMKISEETIYTGLDVYEDLVGFTNQFLQHVQFKGEVRTHSLTHGYPKDLPLVHLALMLKIIPCLEQLDKSIPPMLLENIRAENVMISFPVHSLGGRAKGMADYYTDHFLTMMQGKDWQITRFDFSSELVFLLQDCTSGREI